VNDRPKNDPIRLAEEAATRHRESAKTTDNHLDAAWHITDAELFESLARALKEALEKNERLKNTVELVSTCKGSAWYSEVVRLESQVEELEGALRPFAEPPEKWQQLFEGRQLVWFGVEEIEAAIAALYSLRYPGEAPAQPMMEDEE